jgi:alkaline phosphatase
VDVNLYAKGDGTEVLRGSHENTDIGDFIIDFLGLDLNDLTNKLVNCR